MLIAESNKKEELEEVVIVVCCSDRIVVFTESVCVGSVVFVFSVPLEGVVETDGVDGIPALRGFDGVEDVLEEVLLPNGCLGGNG